MKSNIIALISSVLVLLLFLYMFAYGGYAADEMMTYREYSDKIGLIETIVLISSIVNLISNIYIILCRKTKSIF